MAAIKQLYDLQTVDLELDWRHARLAEIGRALGDGSALKPLRTEVARLELATQRTRGDQTNLDSIIGGFEAKIADAEAKLYGGKVTLARELQDLQADIGMITRQRSEQEDLLLAALDEVDEAQKAFSDASEKLTTWEARWLAGQQAMTEERSVLDGELGDLQANRDARVNGIPALELALYEQVRKNHQGKAVAVLHGTMCESCRVGIPTRHAQDARTSDKPVRCPNCGLILLVE
jgi:predicted  nucleic acid-binding Zn-ribbon protein